MGSKQGNKRKTGRVQKRPKTASSEEGATRGDGGETRGPAGPEGDQRGGDQGGQGHRVTIRSTNEQQLWA